MNDNSVFFVAIFVVQEKILKAFAEPLSVKDARAYFIHELKTLFDEFNAENQETSLHVAEYYCRCRECVEIALEGDTCAIRHFPCAERTLVFSHAPDDHIRVALESGAENE